MADSNVIMDTGETLVGLLREQIPDWLLPPEQIAVAGYGDFARLPSVDAPSVTVFLHHVDVRYKLRATAQNPGLPLSLSYLVTPWAMAAADESRLLGTILLAINRASVVPAALRRGDSWEEHDTVQFVINEMPRELEMQLWDAMRVPFRTSIACEAQVFQLEGPA